MAPTDDQNGSIRAACREVWDQLTPDQRLRLIEAARGSLADAGLSSASETAWAVAVGITWGASAVAPPYFMAMAYVALGEGWES